jgi:hypothetical protein
MAIADGKAAIAVTVIISGAGAEPGGGGKSKNGGTETGHKHRDSPENPK